MQKCSPCRDIFNDMLHATCTRGNWVDSQLLVFGSQIANLTLDLSFGHNLCFRCPNGSCEPIFDIYVSIYLQWYKEHLNPMDFWPLQSPSKNLGVHWVSNSQNGSSLRSVRVHSLTLFCIPGSMKCDSQASFLAHNLTSLCLGREPKVRVVTLKMGGVKSLLREKENWRKKWSNLLPPTPLLKFIWTRIWR